MVIKYKFLDNATSEVEVDDELGKHITEMNDAAAKIDRKETRRHVYMSELEEKGHYIPADTDPLNDVLKEERIGNSWRRLKSCSRSKRCCLSVCTGTRNIKRISPPRKAFHNRR